MGGVFGVIDPDASSISAAVQSLQTAMAYRGPDGMRVWVSPTAAIGHTLRFDTPESRFEQLPATDPHGQFILTAAVRLDNRDDLCRLLDVSSAEHPVTADGDLVLRAYARWGAACFPRLIGDWSLAVWHPLDRRLVLARDHHGNTALHYASVNGRIAFATDLRALRTLAHISSEINELFLAQLLLSWPAFQGEHTAFREIRRVPPAHAIEFANGAERKWCYWQPDTNQQRFSSADDALAALLHVFEQSVAARVRSTKPVGITLSAGLDSNAVAAMAVKLRSPDEITALTAVPKLDPTGWIDPSGIGNEWAGAAAATKHLGITRHVAVRSEQLGPIEGIRRMLTLHGEPLFAASNLYWVVDLLTQAHAHGVGCVLTGQGGNATISWHGAIDRAPLSWFLEKRQFRELLRWKLLSAVLPRSIAAWLPMLRRTSAIRTWPYWRNYSALHPRAFARLGLDEQLKQAGHDLYFSNVSNDRRAFLLPGQSTLGVFWSVMGAAHRVDVRDPTLDPRVIETCWSIAEPFWLAKGSRSLLRRGLEGQIADEVRLASRRGRQAADLVPRLAEEAAILGAALDEVSTSVQANKLIDINYLRTIAGETLGPPRPSTTFRASTILLRGLMVGLFLAGLDKGKIS